MSCLEVCQKSYGGRGEDRLRSVGRWVPANNGSSGSGSEFEGR